VLAAGIAVLIVRGGAQSFRGAFALMLVATVIDATDGFLARKVGVKRVLPHFDGRRLDDLIDFLNYTFLPLLLVWRAELVTGPYDFALLLPLLASAYGFCQVDAKTDDGYFLGFPSLWNVTAFYLYVLRLPSALTLGFVVLFSVLTFVPSRYLYPTQPGRLNRVSNVLGIVWTGMLAWVLWKLPSDRFHEPFEHVWWVAIVSLYYPIFYMAASWTITLRRWLAPAARTEIANGVGRE
jgi:phosphatidylcholine synthase